MHESRTICDQSKRLADVADLQHCVIIGHHHLFDDDRHHRHDSDDHGNLLMIIIVIFKWSSQWWSSLYVIRASVWWWWWSSSFYVISAKVSNLEELDPESELIIVQPLFNQDKKRVNQPRQKDWINQDQRVNNQIQKSESTKTKESINPPPTVCEEKVQSSWRHISSMSLS